MTLVWRKKASCKRVLSIWINRRSGFDCSGSGVGEQRLAATLSRPTWFFPGGWLFALCQAGNIAFS